MRSKVKANSLVASRVLKACVNGASGVRITHQDSPNSMKVISYLLLIDEGLIEVVSEGSRIVHRTTPKGVGLIETFEHSHCQIDELICEA